MGHSELRDTQLDRLIIFYSRFYIPSQSFACVVYSCVGLLPGLWYRDDVSPRLPLDFFLSRKAFFQRPFGSLKLSPLFLLFSLCPDICYQVSQTALALYSGSIAPCVSAACHLFISESSLCFLQCFVPTRLVIPP